MSFKTAAVLALATLLSSSPALAEGGKKGEQTGQKGNVDTKATQWVNEQAQANVTEVLVGKIVFENANHQRVKDFGKTLISEHAKIARDLQDVAQREGVRLDQDVASAIQTISRFAPQTAGFGTQVGSAVEPGSRTFEREGTPGTTGDESGDKPGTKTGDTGMKQGQTGQGHMGQTGEGTMKQGSTYGATGQKTGATGMTQDAEIANLEVEGLDEKLDVKYQRDIDKVQKLKGDADFDRKFLDITIADHEKDVKELESATRTLKNDALKEAANKALPMLKQHLQTAQNLKREVASPPAFERAGSPDENQPGMKDKDKSGMGQPGSKDKDDQTNPTYDQPRSPQTP